MFPYSLQTSSGMRCHLDGTRASVDRRDRLQCRQLPLFSHHRDKCALEQSAETGCHFCAMMFEALFGPLGGSGCLPAYQFARGEVILRREVVQEWLRKENGFENWNRFDWILCPV